MRKNIADQYQPNIFDKKFYSRSPLAFCRHKLNMLHRESVVSYVELAAQCTLFFGQRRSGKKILKKYLVDIDHHIFLCTFWYMYQRFCFLLCVQYTDGYLPENNIFSVFLRNKNTFFFLTKIDFWWHIFLIFSKSGGYFVASFFGIRENGRFRPNKYCF